MKQQKLQLAWLQLIKNKGRLLVALAGIAFACILIFVEIGFEQALYKGAVRPHEAIRGDLFLVNNQYQSVFRMKSFARSRLYQCLSIDGVKAVHPVYLSQISWKNPLTKKSRDIMIFGVDPLNSPLFLANATISVSNLKDLGTALFDKNSRPEYGEIAESVIKSRNVTLEVNRRAIRIVGLFSLGTSFSADGNMVVSDSTFLRLFPERSPQQIEVGAIDLMPGADQAHVQAQINELLNPGVKALNRQEFIDAEKLYWASSSGIGFIFGLGVIVGFIVGVVIVYQILSSDVTDHLPEYATLKAIGYSNNYLLSVIMEESIILAVLGFIPGVLISVALYEVAKAATLYPLDMTPERLAYVFALNLVMCLVSGFIATNKLRNTDPADLF